MIFFKNGYNGGGGRWELFTRKGGRGRGWEIFKGSLHSWQRAANPLLNEDPSCIGYHPPPFFQFLSTTTTTPNFLSPPTPTPTVFPVDLFLWLNGWSHHIWCAIFLNDNLDLHMLSLDTLVPEGPWFVFYATKHQDYWGLAHNVVFTGTLIITCTNTHSTRRGQ